MDGLHAAWHESKTHISETEVKHVHILKEHKSASLKSGLEEHNDYGRHGQSEHQGNTMLVSRPRHILIVKDFLLECAYYQLPELRASGCSHIHPTPPPPTMFGWLFACSVARLFVSLSVCAVVCLVAGFVCVFVCLYVWSSLIGKLKICTLHKKKQISKSPLSANKAHTAAHLEPDTGQSRTSMRQLVAILFSDVRLLIFRN